MSVYFATPAPFDLKALKIMGLSVKVKDNPIGYFGTGLKYAIAICLRNGCNVTLKTAGETYKFTYKEELFRGDPVNQIYMNDVPLPFTLEYGKNWKLWMAFREFESSGTTIAWGCPVPNPATVLAPPAMVTVCPVM